MLDTHIAVALYEGRGSGLGPAARRAIDRGKVVISPAVLLELELLHEIGRLRHGGTHVAEYLARELDIPVAGDRFADVVREALGLAFTRDPFDRLIVAHAILLDAPLVTLDRTIGRHYPRSL
jgi:PIN domain nuclease of toxin-antitoxin system